MPGGFKESPLRLNEGLGALDGWSETEIMERAKRLANKAVRVWASPKLSAEVLETYRSKPKHTTSYSLGLHPNLAEDSPMRSVFEALRREIMALDPCVNEEILKLYIAYKAETNFVDIVPQKSRLRLTMNMHFHELYDPRGYARDVTNLGRWGNGDVEVAISKQEEIPYVMGLVRQAFEKQMGNGDNGQ